MALSTKGMGSTPSFAKTFKPGNIYAKINSIAISEDRFNPEARVVTLAMEGVDLGEEFEGFQIDMNDASKGRHKGQIANVKAGYWAFKDGVVGGQPVSRDTSILKFIASLATSMDKKAEMDAVKAETIEEFIAAANTILCDGTFLHYCVAGKEYTNKGGYPAYDMFLAKSDYKAKRYAFAKTEDSLMKFDGSKHLIAKVDKAVPAVDEFDAATPTEFTM